MISQEPFTGPAKSACSPDYAESAFGHGYICIKATFAAIMHPVHCFTNLNLFVHILPIHVTPREVFHPGNHYMEVSPYSVLQCFGYYHPLCI